MIRFLTAGAAVGVLISGCAALDDLGPRDYPLEQLVAIDVGAETEAEAQQAFESKPEQGESSVAEADRPNGPGATPILDGDRTASKPEPDLAKPDLAKPETAKPETAKPETTARKPEPQKPAPAAAAKQAEAAARPAPPKPEPQKTAAAAPAAKATQPAAAPTAERREVGNTLSVFDTACLSNRRSADRGLARLKEIGFRSAGAAGSSRLVLDNIVADAVADGAGGVRCFTATPVTDANAFVESVDLLMKKRFKNKVARGQVNGAPAWKATPDGEPPFIVAVRGAQQAPDQPVVAIVTLLAPPA